MTKSKTVGCGCIFLLVFSCLGNVYQWRTSSQEIIALRKQVESLPQQDRHQSLRKTFIITQALSIHEPYTLIAGDSIIEGFFITQLPDGSPVLNAGIGGAGIKGIREMLSVYPHNSVKRIIIAIGVNDAVKSNNSFEIDQLHSEYLELLRQAKMITSEVYVCRILPVEGGKGLGTEYFDTTRIEALNTVISEASRVCGAILINTDEPLIKGQKQGKTFTTDGVHLTSEGADLLRQTILSNLH